MLLSLWFFIGFCFTRKYQTRPKMLAMNKHSSLFCGNKGRLRVGVESSFSQPSILRTTKLECWSLASMSMEILLSLSLPLSLFLHKIYQTQNSCKHASLFSNRIDEKSVITLKARWHNTQHNISLIPRKNLSNLIMASVITLNVILMRVITPSVAMLNLVMPSVVMPNVIMLCAVR